MTYVRQSARALGQFVRATLDVRERYSDDATIVAYEDMQRSPESILAETFCFLGVTGAPDIVAHCIGQADFVAMSGGHPAGVERSGSFFRKGVAGDWMSTLTPQMKDLIMRELGWMFPLFGWPR